MAIGVGSICLPVLTFNCSLPPAPLGVDAAGAAAPSASPFEGVPLPVLSEIAAAPEARPPPRCCLRRWQPRQRQRWGACNGSSHGGQGGRFSTSQARHVHERGSTSVAARRTGDDGSMRALVCAREGGGGGDLSCRSAYSSILMRLTRSRLTFSWDRLSLSNVATRACADNTDGKAPKGKRTNNSQVS